MVGRLPCKRRAGSSILLTPTQIALVTCEFRTGGYVGDDRGDTRRVISQRVAVSTRYRGEQCATT